MAKEATVTQIKAGDTDAAKNTAAIASDKSAKGGRKRAPENETPRERFKRVAGGRLLNAIGAIKLLAQISGKEYEFTAADVDKIKTTLESECGKMLSALRGEKKEKEAVKLFD